jgi:multiple sugar transport system substrate-binding protein
MAGNFFAQTLATMDNAYLRPRYNGFIDFQESAGKPLLRYLQGETDAKTALEQINRIYRDSRRAEVGR